MKDKEKFLAEEKLREIIREKINFRDQENEDDHYHYDGFDMSGYGTAHWDNLALLSRFSKYMCHQDNERIYTFVIPKFWKGGGELIKIVGKPNFGDEIVGEMLEGVSGELTEDIIFKVICYQNPKILEEILEEDEEISKEILNDIGELKNEDSNYEKSVVLKRFKRNISLVKELKKKYKNCQLCSFTFKKKDGEPYNETHHIIPLSEKGKDENINTLVLCANCHRQLHYADVDISNIMNGEVSINGEKRRIKEDETPRSS